tara:strand:- start:175 stop:594 length:420 start_codon:yes stop_codon:yes gene_type:complete
MPKVKVTNAKGLVQETGTGPSSFAPGLGVGAQAVTATGSNSQANSAAISASGGSVVIVTGAGSNKGVRLPLLSSVPAGTMYYILNDAAATLEVFPGVGDQIHPAADNAGITVAAGGMLLCISDAAGVLWASAEPAATAA